MIQVPITTNNLRTFFPIQPNFLIKSLFEVSVRVLNEITPMMLVVAPCLVGDLRCINGYLASMKVSIYIVYEPLQISYLKPEFLLSIVASAKFFCIWRGLYPNSFKLI